MKVSEESGQVKQRVGVRVHCLGSEHRGGEFQVSRLMLPLVLTTPFAKIGVFHECEIEYSSQFGVEHQVEEYGRCGSESKTFPVQQ